MLDKYDRIIIIISVLAPRPTRRKASGGVIFYGGPQMSSEPLVKRAVAFIDGQNLYHAARESFGYMPTPILMSTHFPYIFAVAKVGN